MLLLLLWLIIEVTEALEELRKLLETINNSKYASCNSYIIIVILLTCYSHTMQIRQEQAGDRGVDVDGGVDGGNIITILFLSSSYIYIIYDIMYLIYYFIIYLLIIYSFTLVLKSETRCLLQGKHYKFSQQTSTLATGKYPNTGLYYKRERFTGLLIINISAKH